MSSDQFLSKKYATALYLKGLAAESFKRKYSDEQYPVEHIPQGHATVELVGWKFNQYFRDEINEKQLTKELEEYTFDNMEIIRIITEINRFRKRVANEAFKTKNNR